MPSRDQIVNAHRADSARQSRTVADTVASLAGLIDLDNPRISRLRWLAAALAVTRDAHQQSAFTAAGWYLRLRGLEGFLQQLPAVAAAAFDADRAAAALVAAGPVPMWQRLSSGAGRDVVVRQFASATGQAAAAVAADGGHATVTRFTAADPQARGWARRTSGGCAWCVMLASRGVVHRTKAAAGFDAHALCRCIPVPVFTQRQAAAVDAHAEPVRRMWAEARAEVGGTGRSAVSEQMAVFRRMWRDHTTTATADVA